MSSNEDMDMEEVPNAETNPAVGKTPAQVAHENRLGPDTPEQADPFPGGPITLHFHYIF